MDLRQDALYFTPFPLISLPSLQIMGKIDVLYLLN